LKATTVVFSNEVCSLFTAMSSRTLLSLHVQRLTNTCFESWKPQVRLSAWKPGDLVQSMVDFCNISVDGTCAGK